jgi:hypothetical protein
MKSHVTIIGIFMLIATFSCQNKGNQQVETVSAEEDSAVYLFNGENLDGLEIYIEDTTYNKDSVWQVRDGNLFTTGMPFGYIRTIEEYDNYELNVEWRWVEEPKNSGVLLHIQGEDKLWPICIEAQLMSGKAGDFVAMGGTSFKERIDTSSIVVPKFEASSEKTPGEWNRYEITCKDNTITLIVNGILQNEATETTVSSGKIGLQSEGGPMEFRNFYLKEI